MKPAFKVSLPTFFLLNDCRYFVTVLMAVNLIDIELMWELGISTIPCTPPLRVTAINDQPIRKGLITHHTVQFNVEIRLFHREKLHFFILSSPSNPVVFGLPWLQTHDPIISWKDEELREWSPFCRRNRFHNLLTRPCLSMSVESPKSALRVPLPREYQSSWMCSARRELWDYHCINHGIVLLSSWLLA